MKHNHDVNVNLPKEVTDLAQGVHAAPAKIKQHLQENKTTYLSSLGCLALGLALGRKAPVVKQVARNVALVQTSPTATNIAVTQLVRRGHPGYMIKCVDTGEVFASIRRAAEASNVSRSELYRHLQGDIPKAGGFVFENLGEMK